MSPKRNISAHVGNTETIALMNSKRREKGSLEFECMTFDEVTSIINASSLNISQIMAQLEERANIATVLHANIDSQIKMVLEVVETARVVAHTKVDEEIQYQMREIKTYVESLEMKIGHAHELYELLEKSIENHDDYDCAQLRSDSVAILQQDIVNEEIAKSSMNSKVREMELRMSCQLHDLLSATTDLLYFKFSNNDCFSSCSFESAVNMVQFNKVCNVVKLFPAQNCDGIDMYSIVFDHVHVCDAMTGETKNKSIGKNNFICPGGLALWREDSITWLMISDAEKNQICIFDAVTGVLIKTLGSTGKLSGQLLHPWGICVAPSRDWLYVAEGGNSRVQIFDLKSGKSVMSIGHPGDDVASTNDPMSLTIFEGNNVSTNTLLFVGDCNSHVVKVFDAVTGSFMKTIGQGRGSAAGELEWPMGLACVSLDDNSDPLLLVSDSSNNRIQIFNVVTGHVLKSVGDKGAALGKLKSPYDIWACVRDNNIFVYVADSKNNRVQKLMVTL